MTPAHRKDIDGLRAVAVLSVFGFHLGLPGMRGGFVGVDVFFVISGYLIGNIIFGAAREGRFSFADFYARRCRRILPALFAMLAVVTPAALILVLPGRLTAYPHSLGAAAASVSNLYFLRVANYFFRADDQILLHTWSLGVEEQYYFLFPLLAAGLVRWAPKRVLGAVALCLLGSFAVASFTVSNHPVGTFFALPTRAWELLAGVVVGLGTLPFFEKRVAREAAAAFGFACIVGSVIFLSREVRFPGPWAAPSCVGAALLIGAGARGPTLSGRLLSNRVFAFLGLVSYSFYLWHWPLIVLARQGFALNLESAGARFAVFSLTLLLATLSWRFVEQPFRTATGSPSKTFAYSGLAAMATLIISVVIHVGHGFPGRFDPSINRLAANIDADLPPPPGGCGPTTTWASTPRQICLRRAADRPNVLVVGDSFSFHLLGGLVRGYPEVNVMYESIAGCLPVVARRDTENHECGAAMAELYAHYLENNPVDAVILSARWDARDLVEIAATMDRLNALHQPMILTGVVPEYQLALPQLLAIAGLRGNPGVVPNNRVPDRATLDEAMAKLAATHRVPYVSLYKKLCAAGCRTTDADGTPLQSDYGHLTLSGSTWVAEEFRATFAALLRQPAPTPTLPGEEAARPVARFSPPAPAHPPP